MLALAKVDTAPGLKLIERPEPKVQGPTDVLIEVGACGICGADVLFYESSEKHVAMITAFGMPRVLGHEIAGTVVDVGRAVTAFRPGDRVAPEPLKPCFGCYYCRHGQYNLCEEWLETSLGIGKDGGYARYVVADHAQLYRLPEGIAFAEASILEALGVGVRALERSHVKPGDTAVVIGPGALGLMAAMLLQKTNVQVILAGRASSRDRLRLGAELGLETIEIDGDNLRDAAISLSGAPGADVVFDFAGGAEPLAQAIKVARKGGEIVLVGIAPPGVTDQMQIVQKELTIVGAVARTVSTWERTLHIVAQRTIDLGKIITHTLPLRDFESGFRLLQGRRALKVVLIP